MVEEAAWTHAHDSAEGGQDRRPRWDTARHRGRRTRGRRSARSPGFTDPPAFGFLGRGNRREIVVVNVGGHEVLITIGADSPDRFKRAVAALQPLVNSIDWR